MPTGLPTSSPSSTARPVDELKALDSDSPDMATPVLARAKTGTMSSAVNG